MLDFANISSHDRRMAHLHMQILTSRGAPELFEAFQTIIEEHPEAAGAEEMEHAVRLLNPLDSGVAPPADRAEAHRLANVAAERNREVWFRLAEGVVAYVGRMRHLDLGDR